MPGKHERRTLHRKKQGLDVFHDDQVAALDLDGDDDDAQKKINNKNSNKKRSLQDEEETIVHNLKSSRRVPNDGDEEGFSEDVLQVLPRDSHHKRNEGTRGALGAANRNATNKTGSSSNNKKKASSLFQDDDDDDGPLGEGTTDDATLAMMMSRNDRQRLVDADFDLGGGLAAGALNPEQYPEDETTAMIGGATIMQVDSVAGQFAALSATERFQIIKAQSPEVEKLIEEMQQHLAELRSIFAPLRAALFDRRKSLKKAGPAAADSMLLEFLETKVQLMLSYCVHILFYLLLKVEGKKVTGHPVLKRLVELRVYLEKLHPVEQRLQHSITRLLSGDGATSSSAAASAASGQARLSKLRPKQDNNGIGGGGADGKYVARKTAPVIDELRQRRRAEAIADEMQALEREEERTMQRKRLTRAEAAKYSGALEPVAIDVQEEEADQFLSSATSFLGGSAAKKQKKSSNNDDDDDDENGGGLSLIEKLRLARAQAQKRSSAAAATDDSSASSVSRVDLVAGGSNAQSKRLLKERKKRTAEDRKRQEGEEEEEGGDFNGEGGDDDDDFDGGVPDYDQLVQEQEERDAASRDLKKYRAENPYQEPEKKRRDINTDIQKHRGLTRERPKDRKNPRVNAKRKFQAGTRVAKAQSRTVTDGAARSDGSNAALKPHVTHSMKF